MGTLIEIKVPDIGDFQNVEIIEVLVAPGNQIKADAPLITVESDKATMEVPTPYAGIVKEIAVSVGDRVSEGSLILTMEAESMEMDDDKVEAVRAVVSNGISISIAKANRPVAGNDKSPPAPRSFQISDTGTDVDTSRTSPYASPSVRRFARQSSVKLDHVAGTGRKGRILREDVERFAKEKQYVPDYAAGPVPSEKPSPKISDVDFSSFGPVESKPLSRIQRISGTNLHRIWTDIPHVTHHDLVDITDLEKFRKSIRVESDTLGVRVTLLTFLMKASVAALKAFPTFNASLAADGENLIIKHYYHIGIAVDTLEGLLVPVIRNVDEKSIFELADELTTLSTRALEKKLTPQDLQGGCFTISSLGGIGGTGFTPILNAPEVAILGAARSSIQPVYLNGEFKPRRMLPLSLSYDHRVIDGANGARFMAFLCSLLADIRRLLL